MTCMRPLVVADRVASTSTTPMSTMSTRACGSTEMLQSVAATSSRVTGSSAMGMEGEGEERSGYIG